MPLKALEEAGLIVTAEPIVPPGKKRTQLIEEGQDSLSAEALDCPEIDLEFERLSAELVLNDRRIEILN